jgi:DNA polymerase-3 subunit alpha
MATASSFDNVSKVLSGKYGKYGDKVKAEHLKPEKELKQLLQMTAKEAKDIKELMTQEPIRDQLTPDHVSFNEALYELYNTSAYKELFDIAMALNGCISSTGSHPGAVIVTKEPIWNHCSRVNNGAKYPDDTPLYVTSFEKYNCEEINTMKFDILRLRELVIVSNTLKFIKESTGIDIDLKKINPYDVDSNMKILKLLRDGDTDGVFQFSSHLYKGIIEEVLGNLDHLNQEDVAKDLFNIIVALEALGRPGPLEGGMVPRFAEFLAYPERAEKIHPEVDKILAETYSNMLYQEQIMFILMRMGGFSLGQADMVRRGIASGTVSKIEAQRGAYVDGVQKVQLEKNPDTSPEEMAELLELANRIFDLMAKWAGYGFNKAHSVGYGVLSHRGAWLKVNYKAQFMAALMSASEQDRIVKYIDEIRSRGIKVLQPKINKSKRGFVVIGEEILYGMEAVNGVGEKAIEKIIEGYPYVNFMDFLMKKVASKTAIVPLIKAGYFDEDKRFLLKYYESLAEIREAKTKSEESLIKYMEENGINERTYTEISSRLDNIIYEKSLKKRTEKTKAECLALINNEKYSNLDLLNFEKEVIGMYLSDNPLSQFHDIIYGGTVLQKDIKDHTMKEEIFIAGIVNEVKTILDKHKKTMAFIKIQMVDGMQDCVMFHEPYAKYKGNVVENKTVMIKGNKGKNGGFVITRISDVEDKQEAYRDFFGINKGVV